jgi:hypothetical protein
VAKEVDVMSMVDTRPAPAVRAPGTMSGRLAALAGAVSFVLILISASMLSNSPSAADSGQKIFSYLALHHGRLQLGAVLAALAMATALVWAAGLFRALRRAEGGTPGLALAAFGGGVLTAASMVTWALIEGTMATRFHDLGPAGARVFWTMFLLNVGAILVGLLVVIGATAIVALRARLFPRWFAVASTVLALVSVAGACTVGYTTTGIQIVAGVAIILDGVWILMVSIYLWRDPALTLP